jgi:subtilisin family serine protease
LAGGRSRAVSPWVTVLVLTAACSASVTAPVHAADPGLEQPLSTAVGVVPPDSESRIPLLLTGAQDALAARVRELGGEVDYRFLNAPYLAARVPAQKLPELLRDPALLDVERQRIVRRTVADVNLPGFGRLAGGMMALRNLGDTQVRTLSPAEIERSVVNGPGAPPPATFLGYEAWTRASEVWERATFGAGTIVVVIDTGIYPDHPLIAGSVIGGFNLVPAEEEAEIDLDGDGQPDGRSFDWNVIQNDAHGTSVSGLIAGHADLVLKRDSRMIQSLAIHGPETLVPVPDDTTRVGVRLLGTAPQASLYGIKVFPYDGGSAPDARVAEALDRVIKMKESGELATDVVNMSLGGPSLWDGHGVLDEMVDLATERGITVVVAAGNDGPAFMSSGTPANAFTSLAVGAASDPLHTRVAIDQFFSQGPVGTGSVAYPYDDLQMASFSGRGLTADDRVKPDIAATGFLNFIGFLVDEDEDGVNDDVGFGIGAGTSFASPITAGGAALLVAYGRKIGDHGRAPYVANALLGGARRIADFDRVPEIDQGLGYLVLPRAFALLETGAWNTPPRDAANPMMEFVNLGNRPVVTAACPSLGPGESFSYVLRVPRSATQVTFTFPEVTLGEAQNPFLGDQLQVNLHSAKRGGNGDYVFSSQAIEPGERFTYESPEPGEVRLTFTGGFTNVSPVAGRFTAELLADPIPAERTFGGSVGHDGVWERTFDVPADLQSMAVSVGWAHSWTVSPTFDLDFYLQSPDSVLYLDGATLRSPEVVFLSKPLPGTWQLRVVDVGTVLDREWFRVAVDYDAVAATRSPGSPPPGSDPTSATSKIAPLLTVLGATPNPARPETAIRFALGGSGGPVTVAIYDVAGRLVRRLASGPLVPGVHALAWDGRNDAGNPVGAGLYVYRITAPGGAASRKLILER